MRRTLLSTFLRRRTYTNNTTRYSFGFKNVSEEEKGRLVKNVFDKVASRYDFMNDIMTAGLHRRWKDHFVSSYLFPMSGMRALDVAGGTGDIAFRILDRAIRKEVSNAKVTVLDVNEQMLNIGQRRAVQEGFREGLQWVLGDAESLPFVEDSFDVYTIAFGIRNCTQIDRVLQEAHRVLKPGGAFLCLELSPDAFIGSPAWVRRLYDRYSFEIIPVLGQLFAADRLSYQYLVESIRKFPSNEKFIAMIKDAGFTRIASEGLFSNIATIHSAWKPKSVSD